MSMLSSIRRLLSGWLSGWQYARLRRAGLQLGHDSYIMRPIRINHAEAFLLSIGQHVLISGDVDFIMHDGGIWVFHDRPGYQKVIKFGRITIHNNCYIGQGVKIMPGVTIGSNSVVAAGALLTKDVPPGEVWGGVPAKLICTVDEYAQRSLDQTPAYDDKAYKTDKKRELLRIFPRPW